MNAMLLLIIFQLYLLGALVLGFINSPLSLARLPMSVRALFIVPTLMMFAVLYSFYVEIQSTVVTWQGIRMTEFDIWGFGATVVVFALTVFLPNNFGLKTNHEEVIQEYLTRNKNKQLEE